MDLKDEFLKLKVNQQNVDALHILSIALISEIILNKKDFYKKKVELKKFISQVLQIDYKDYLFDARSILCGRVIKDIRLYRKNDLDKFYILVKRLQKFIIKSELFDKEEDNNIPTEEPIKKGTNKTGNSNKKVIDDWRSIIES